MTLQVSCPVFSCRKTSIHLCAGYRRTCDRYYCKIHTKGNLCERCEGDKQEDMRTTYKLMMKDVMSGGFSAGMSGGPGVLFIVTLLLVAAAVVLGLKQGRNDGLLPLFVITLGVAVLTFAAAIAWYLTKSRDYMRSRSLEIDEEYPGFYDLYEKVQKKLDDISA